MVYSKVIRRWLGQCTRGGKGEIPGLREITFPPPNEHLDRGYTDMRGKLLSAPDEEVRLNVSSVQVTWQTVAFQSLHLGIYGSKSSGRETVYWSCLSGSSPAK